MEKKKTTLDYFTPAFVQAQRKKLEKQLDLLTKQQKELSSFPDIGDSIDDSAQETSEYEGNLVLKERLSTSIKAIRRALKRIEAGTYGICKKTKLPIEKARLQVIPEAEYSADAEPR